MQYIKNISIKGKNKTESHGLRDPIAYLVTQIFGFQISKTTKVYLQQNRVSILEINPQKLP